MYKPSIVAGIFFATTAVIIGAFGAHYLKSILNTEQLASFETGVRYQFYHAFALMLTGIILKENKSAIIISILFSIAIVLFSGSIYALTILKATTQIGLGSIGILTPIGGVFFIIAWCMLAVSVYKNKN